MQVLFNDGGSSASFLTASKALDAISLLPGNDGEQSDAPQAYTQCKLGAETQGHAETCVTLPEHARPDDWKKFRDPVCPLRLSLYGHPLSGVFWERHCHARLKEAGFVQVQGWECLFVHYELRMVLSVYVDDFKMAGPKENLAKAWDLIRSHGIKLDEPTKFTSQVSW